MTDEPKRKGGKRTGAGRPNKPEGTHLVYMQITLSAQMRDFAKAQPGGASAYIRRLIEADTVRSK